MKILFASISFTTPYQPQRKFLSLGYLHAYAHADPQVGPRAEMVHRYYDPAELGPEAVGEAMAQEDPDLAALTCYVWNAADVIAAARTLKELRPRARIILGGPEVSYHHARILAANPHIDWIGVGEGEVTFRDLVVHLLDGRESELAGVAGLAQRCGGKPYLGAPRAFLEDLDAIPSPYLSGVLEVCPTRGGVLYQAARGCPFVCSFCDYGRNQPYHEFSLERVRAEFEYFKAHGARWLYNVDPTFNYRRKRAAQMLRLALELDLRALHWIEIYPSLLDEELIDLLERSHLVFMGVGIQSTRRETMRNIRRIWDPERTAALLDRLQGRANVMFSYEVIMGLPGDTLRDFKRTLTWAYERLPADIKSFNLAILPRTPLEQEVDRWGIEYDPEVGHEVMATGTIPHEEVLIGKAINDWHRLLQSLFQRLLHFFERPIAEIMQEWSHRVFEAGLAGRIEDLHAHRFEPELVEELAALWHSLVREHCEIESTPPVADALTDLFRYHFHRRRRTWTSAFLSDVRDIYFGDPHAHLHQIYDARGAALARGGWEGYSGSVARASRPLPGGPFDLRVLSHDMKRIYPLLDPQELAAVTPSPTQYAFFTHPRSGAGCAVALDEAACRFLELTDGRRTVGRIGAILADELGALSGAGAAAIHAALRRSGILERPSFAAAPGWGSAR